MSETCSAIDPPLVPSISDQAPGSIPFDRLATKDCLMLEFGHWSGDFVNMFEHTRPGHAAVLCAVSAAQSRDDRGF